MKRTDSERYLRLRDNLAIFLPNAATKTWYVRIRKDGKEIKKSLKTRDIREAENLARDLFHALTYKKNNNEIKNIKLTNTTFSDYKDIITTYFDKKFTVNTIKGVNRSFILFMKHFKDTDVNDLMSKDIEFLIDEYDMKKSRLKDFKMMIFAAYDSLEANKLIERRPIFPIYNVVKSDSYAAFSDFELNEILKEIYRIRFDFERTLINFETCLYYSLLEAIGCRPGDELLKIKLVDFFKQDNDICLNIKNGKNKDRGGNRSIVLNEKAMMHLNLFFAAKFDISNIEEANKLFLSKISKSQEFLFNEVNHDNLTKVLRNLVKTLKEKDLLDKNKRIAPYSFRHTYITNALKQGTDIYLLAKICGTSVKEIEKKYSKMTVLDRKEDALKIKTNDLDLRN